MQAPDKNTMKSITVKELALMDPLSYKLIDIRESWEIEEHGKIPSAQNIIMEKVLESEIWKNNCNIIFYCRSGRRSSAINLHLTHFYKASNTYNLIGGYNEWKEHEL